MATAAPTAGPLLKEWRHRRRRSQLDLAVDVGVSPRHLSFVETGRSKPSTELLLLLADHLDIPLRERNALLLAAGYAPRYSHASLDDAGMAQVRDALQRLLAGHQPYPGVVIDRVWNVVLANDAALDLVRLLPPELAQPPLNVFRACLHPDGLAARTANFPEWSSYLLGQLHRVTLLTGDRDAEALADEIAGYPNISERSRWLQSVADEHAILIPWRLGVDGAELSFFTTLTTFGTPQDITLDELAVELFYPADATTERALQAHARRERVV